MDADHSKELLGLDRNYSFFEFYLLHLCFSASICGSWMLLASCSRIFNTIVRTLCSAAAAEATTSSPVVSFGLSGRHSLVTVEMASSRRPACTATNTSGTVDMPTTSPPIFRTNRSSAQSHNSDRQPRRKCHNGRRSFLHADFQGPIDQPTIVRPAHVGKSGAE